MVEADPCLTVREIAAELQVHPSAIGKHERNWKGKKVGRTDDSLF